MDKTTMVHFCLGMVDPSEPVSMIDALNIMDKKGLFIAAIVPGFVPMANNNLAMPGRQANQVRPVVFVYVKTNAKHFEKIFGFEYCRNNLQKIARVTESWKNEVLQAA